MFLDDCGWTFAKDPRQTQTVQSSGLSVFLLKVLWSNGNRKSDLRWTYGLPAGPAKIAVVHEARLRS